MMASQDAGDFPTSKLAQMRMRFQQKTYEEQEHRRQELKSTSTSNTPRPATGRLIGNGKVRQMFDERRRGAGIDRSNPLKPIGDSRAQPQPNEPLEQQQKIQRQQIVKGVSSMSLKEKSVTGKQMSSDSNNNITKYNSIGAVNRLKPVVTRKTPPTRETGSKLQVNASPPTSAKTNPIRVTKTVVAPRVRQTPSRADVTDKGHAAASKVIRQVTPKSPVNKINMENQPPPEGTRICKHCGRHFNTDRLAKHEEVCQRTMTTKRKIFDASKQRVKGTDNEKYSKQQQRGKPNLSRTQSTYSSAAQQQGLNTGVKKSNWRKKHEEFIQAIRAAKQVQAHLARGGKLSDLPPPPPSENPDYIQCPHCGRRFNQQAAERHIPRCATMIHNKPRRSNPQVKR